MDKVRRQGDIFAVFFRTSPDYCSISTLDDGVMIEVNDSFVRITGWPRRDVIGRSALDFGLWPNPDDRQEMVERIRREGHIQVESLVLRTRSGALIDCSATMFAVEYRERECLISIIRDVSARRQAEAELEATRDRFERQARELQTMLDACPLSIGVAVDRKWVLLNRAFERIFGYSIKESLGVSLEMIYPSRQDFDEIGIRINEAMQKSEVSHLEVRYRRKNGEIFWANNYARLIDPLHPEKGAVVILEDISERKAAEERIRHMAEHDQLTGLPNRNLLRDRFEQEMRHANRDQRKLALLFLDLDHFKLVNDSLGHAAGDMLLKAVVERVQSSIREVDTVCRQGGDEFVVLLPDLAESDVVMKVAGRIVDAMSRPFTLAGQDISITFSIGMAFYPDDATSFETLLQCADMAMYQAKQGGRNNCQRYRPGMRE